MRGRKGTDGPYISEIRMNWERVEDRSEYPFSLPIVTNLKRLALHPKVTYFVGPNGSGKSTLIEAIAVAFGFNPEGGSKNFNFATNATHSGLADFLTLVKPGTFPRTGFFLRAESFYNLATEVDRLEAIDPGLLPSYGGKSLHLQSHGESFLALFLNRFGGRGLYILDEPEAALSPDGMVLFLARMHQLVLSGSQFLIATHSPILMMYPDAEVLELEDCELVKKPFQETRNFQLTRALLNRPNIVAEQIVGKAGAIERLEPR
jgi:predicted ATPase